MFAYNVQQKLLINLSGCLAKSSTISQCLFVVFLEDRRKLKSGIQQQHRSSTFCQKYAHRVDKMSEEQGDPCPNKVS